MANFSKAIFKATQPSVLSQGEWVDDADFTQALIRSWTSQYADYLGQEKAGQLVRTLIENNELLDHDKSLTLLSTIEGEKVGIGALRQLGRAGELTLVTMLEVLEEHRGKGIGRQLLEALSTRKTSSLPTPLVAHVSIHRPSVKQFYVDSGFTEFKREFVDHYGYSLEFDVLVR